MDRSGHHRGAVESESVVKMCEALKWMYNEIDNLKYYQRFRAINDDELADLEALERVSDMYTKKLRVDESYKRAAPLTFCGDCTAPLLIYSSHICTNPECEHYLDVPF